jgi:hypothetical protein
VLPSLPCSFQSRVAVFGILTCISRTTSLVSFPVVQFDRQVKAACLSLKGGSRCMLCSLVSIANVNSLWLRRARGDALGPFDPPSSRTDGWPGTAEYLCYTHPVSLPACGSRFTTAEPTPLTPSPRGERISGWTHRDHCWRLTDMASAEEV